MWNLVIWEFGGCVYEDVLLVFLQVQLLPLPIFRDLVSALRRSRSLLAVNDDDDDDVGSPTDVLAAIVVNKR